MEGENAESLGLTGHETFGFDLSENPGVHDVITVTASTPEQTKTLKLWYASMQMLIFATIKMVVSCQWL